MTGVVHVRFLGKWSSQLIAGERNVSFALDDKIVFDFGPHSLESFLESGLNPNDIKIVLISHLHLDHYVGIAELLWYRSINHARNRLTVLGPKGIKKNTEQLMTLLKTPQSWINDQIRPNTKYIEGKSTDSIRVFNADHTVPGCAYRVEYRARKIFYSGDTAYSKEIVEGAKGVDWLFHEMTYTDKDRELAKLWRHSTFSDAMRVFEESGARHIVPVHLSKSSNALILKRTDAMDGLVYPSELLAI